MDQDNMDDNEQGLEEVAPPGMESWIKKNKARFKKQYGDKKGTEILYATAWKRKNANESVKLDEISFPALAAKVLQPLSDRAKTYSYKKKREANKIPDLDADLEAVVPKRPGDVLAKHGITHKDIRKAKQQKMHPKDREKWMYEDPPEKQRLQNAYHELLGLEYPSQEGEIGASLKAASEEYNKAIRDLSDPSQDHESSDNSFRKQGMSNQIRDIINRSQDMEDYINANDKGYIKADTYSGDDFSNPSDKVLSEKNKKGVEMNKSKLGQVVNYRDKRAKVRNIDDQGRFAEIIYEDSKRSEIVDLDLLETPNYIKQNKILINEREFIKQIAQQAIGNKLGADGDNSISGKIFGAYQDYQQIMSMIASALAGAHFGSRRSTSQPEDYSGQNRYGDDVPVENRYGDNSGSRSRYGDQVYYGAPQQESIDELDEDPMSDLGSSDLGSDMSSSDLGSDMSSSDLGSDMSSSDISPDLSSGSFDINESYDYMRNQFSNFLQVSNKQ